MGDEGEDLAEILARDRTAGQSRTVSGGAALQAMRAGCTVLCRDDIDRVGVARFIPSAWRYTDGAAGLSARVAEMASGSVAGSSPAMEAPCCGWDELIGHLRAR